jgi:ectoine hydroxylase-related dioxygenase (phytanoyl-CoA dioxygenase family)
MHASEATVEAVLASLDEHGFCIVEGLLGADVDATRKELTAILDATPEGRNSFEGFRTRRMYAVFAKTRRFDEPAVHPLVLGVTEALLGVNPVLSSVVGIEIGPGETGQPLHRDDGKYPIPRPHQEVILNTMWALDDFTIENGATVIHSGTHRWDGEVETAKTHSVVLNAAAAGSKGKGDGDGKLAQQKLRGKGGGKSLLHEAMRGYAEVKAVMPRGSCMFYRGSVLHGGGANESEAARLGVILEYVAGWLRPQENHVLAVNQRIVRTLPERLQELLGYNVSIHRLAAGPRPPRFPLAMHTVCFDEPVAHATHSSLEWRHRFVFTYPHVSTLPSPHWPPVLANADSPTFHRLCRWQAPAKDSE